MSRKGWILFGVMCLVWGIPYLFIKVAVGGVAVPVVVFARTVLGALVLLPWHCAPGSWASCAVTGVPWPHSPRLR